MTTSSQDDKAKPSPSNKSDFQAAEEIRTILGGREPVEQERIIRWVGESLGLTFQLRQKSQPAAHESPAAEELSDVNSSASGSTSDQATPKDIRSFVQEKQPKNDIQFVATVAYYHRFVADQKKELISADDIQEGARHSSRPVFKTPSITLNNAVNQGYFDRGARGEYKLNAVGENLVAMTLPGTGNGTAARRSVRPRQAAAKKKTNKKAKRS